MPEKNVYRFCRSGCLAERVEYLTLELLEDSGYLAYLKENGYTPLVFGDGKILFLPTSALPEGINENDQIELTIRRI